MNLVVGIATAGRQQILAETLREIAKASRKPDRIVICPVSQEDVPANMLGELDIPVEIANSSPGLTKQRNAIISQCSEADILVFLDDDFFVAHDFFSITEMLFSDYPDVAVATGTVIADGIHGPGFSPEEGRAFLHSDSVPVKSELQETYGAYGCNMILRLAPVRQHGLKFDENLPLYGWQEDIDFSRQLCAYGRVVRSNIMRGVHLGSKRGRSSGLKLGYSQIANPVYLMRKGTLSRRFAGPLMLRNLSKNILRSFWPESHIDRYGRLKGNLIALWDLIRGRIHPERILTM